MIPAVAKRFAKSAVVSNDVLPRRVGLPFVLQLVSHPNLLDFNLCLESS
jgi:hypothetical protein